MSARLIYGKPIAEKVLAQAAQDVARSVEAGFSPHLVAVQVGDDPSALLYARNQQRMCKRLGIPYALYHLDAGTTEQQLSAHLRSLNHNEAVTGIVLQLPLPPAIAAARMQALIDPIKDVEGIGPANLGRVFYRGPALAPCTALAALALIESAGLALNGLETVVVGHSEIVGKPIALLLMNSGATVTVCHEHTRDLAAHTRRADLVVVAVGKPGLLKPDMVKRGAFVVDVGINQVPVQDEGGRTRQDAEGLPVLRTVGDVDPAVAEVAGLLTPVPGGIGPLTVAMLMRNTIEALSLAGPRRRTDDQE